MWYALFMKKIKAFSDADLWENTKLAASSERAASLVVLEHLCEISRRYLYSKRGYESLFEYVVKELGYSESSAYEKTGAVKLMQGSELVREKLASGELTATVAAKLQTFIKKEKITRHEDKSELIQSALGKSKRDLERHLLAKATTPVSVMRAEVQKPLTLEHTELRLIVDNETLELVQEIRKLQGTLGVRTPEIIKSALKTELTRIKKQKLGVGPHATESARKFTQHLEEQAQGASPEAELVTQTFPPTGVMGGVSGSASARVSARENGVKNATHNATNSNSAHGKEILQISAPQISAQTAQLRFRKAESRRPQPMRQPTTFHPRHTPMQLQREIRIRAHNRCEFTDSLTGRRCEARTALQFEHIKPYAWGGSHLLENLKLYCAGHNRLTARLMV
jgi:hypothetical protein